MKQLYIAFFILISVAGYTQSPALINYQAVAHDASGALLAGQSVTVEFGIHQGSATGPLVWEEQHSLTTNSYGLFFAQIGGGTSTGGGSLTSFADIDWGSSGYFLRTEIDAGAGFELISEVAFVSVPYALHSKSTGGINGETINTTGLLDGYILVYNGASGEWEAQAPGSSSFTAGAGIDITSGVISNTGDADNDPTNEIELPSTATTNDVLTWDGTAWVAQAPSGGGDDWGVQVAQTDGSTITGDGTAGSPITGNYQAGSGIDITGATITNTGDGDNDATNEIELPATATTNDVLIWDGTNWVAGASPGDADSDPTNEIELPATATVGDVLEWDGTNWVAGLDNVDDPDNDPANELQNLSFSGNAIGISLGTGFNLTPTAPVDGDVLTWNNTSGQWQSQALPPPPTPNQIHDADADTRIDTEQSTDEDQIRFVTDGSQRMIINNLGHIGIGTNAPNQPLEINYTSTISSDPAEYIVYNFSGTTGGQNGGLLINATGSSSGNVFGVYSEAIGNSSGASIGLGGYSNGNGTGGHVGVDGSANATAGNNTGVFGSAFGSTGGINYGIYGQASGGAGGNWAGYFPIGDVAMGDNVSIGFTAVPVFRLDVRENLASNMPIVNVQNENVSGDASLKFSQGNDYTIGIDDTDNTFKISNATVLGINDRITITAGGNVGIGTTAPSSALQVVGGVAGDLFAYNTPKTDYVTLSGMSFRPAVNTSNTWSAWLGFGQAYMTSETGPMTAKFYLPSGARITNIELRYEDDAVENLAITLRTNSIGGGSSILYSHNTSTNVDGVQTVTAPLSHTVNNNNITYILAVYGGPWSNQTTGNELHFYGAKITYQMDETY